MNSVDHGSGMFQIVASISRPEQMASPLIADADAVEIRLDLMPDLTVESVDILASVYNGPIILTLRSITEGGAFTGDASAWKSMITPFLSLVTMVDVETRYRTHASWLQDIGLTVIASSHTDEMLSYDALISLMSELRTFGDIPKIAVHPVDTSDILVLLQFTHAASKPLIVSVTGTICRYARPILPLFGSLFTYSYIGNPTSPGQYSLEEMRILGRHLSPGIIDIWFDSSAKPEKEEPDK